MSGRIQDLLLDRAAVGFVGRTEELGQLLGALEPGQPPVWFLHGLGGTGKSRLLDVAVDRARALGVASVRIDCRAVEPTAKGFLEELREHVGAAPGSIGELADRVGELGARVLLVLDGYDAFWLMDAWVRQVFVPALPTHVRVFLAGRSEPAMAWSTSPGWSGLFRSIRLSALPRSDAMELLRLHGIEGESARRVFRFSHGCCLALLMAAAAAKERPGRFLDAVTESQLNEKIAAMYLDLAADDATRRTLQAAATVRRMTLPLLAAMLPGEDVTEAWARLRAVPFVEQDRDGLTFHDVVKSGIARTLKATEPGRHLEYRRAAWRRLRVEAREVGTSDVWRYTADMLLLIENERIRDAFFPVEDSRVVVESARPADGASIRVLAERSHGPDAAAAQTRWFERAPETFVVARGSDGTVDGYRSVFAADSLPPEAMRDDPVLRGWLSHLRRHPLPRDGRALFVLHDQGDAPTPVLGALWLDVKRVYLEMRPALRRVYVAARTGMPHDLAMYELGFRRLPEGDVAHDDVCFQTFMLDMGPGSVDGWLAGLVATELGVLEDVGGIVDAASRELVLDGKRVGLTKLEFDLVHYLSSRPGKAVSRADLLADVWGCEYGGGSNVVDAVVRGVRRKMGDRAVMLEAVRGTGYRMRVG